jgi:hypothetical protein
VDGTDRGPGARRASTVRRRTGRRLRPPGHRSAGQREAWLQATQSVSYADPVPSAWIDRARPVITARLATEYDRSRNGGRGAAWPGFRR